MKAKQKLITLRMTLDVTYKHRGVPSAKLQAMLRNNITNLYGEGALTGDTEAEITTLAIDVKETTQIHELSPDDLESLYLLAESHMLAESAKDFEEWDPDDVKDSRAVLDRVKKNLGL